MKSYIDGAFDLVHCGHFNAIRQAHLISEHLVVGVNSDEGIIAVKGPPILTSEERCQIINSCRYVSECIPKTPYTVSENTLNLLGCQYYIHGDDPCVGEDGLDMCEVLASKGRFKQIKRTTGVSTTDITARILRLVSSDENCPKSTFEEAPKQRFL